MRKNCPELVKTVNNNIAQSCMRILDCYMIDYVESEVKRVTVDQVEGLFRQIKELFFFAFVWSIGATTTSAGRERFDKWIREKMEQHELDFPEEKTCYDYLWSGEKIGWALWFDTIPAYEVDIKASFNEIVVPTQDSIRMKYLLKTLVMTNKHVLTPGPTGTGKSVYVNQLVTYEMPEEYQCLAMTFSAQTSANQTQDYLDDKMDKRRSRVYGPPVGKKFITFIDDLNMPAKEEYGA